jgi:hypothetical protein
MSVLKFDPDPKGNGPRKVFVDAWSVWCRDTAKLLAEANGFEEQTTLLHELNIIQDVAGVLVGAVVVSPHE